MSYTSIIGYALKRIRKTSVKKSLEQRFLLERLRESVCIEVARNYHWRTKLAALWFFLFDKLLYRVSAL
jgi:hypothetical protein